MDKTVGYLLCCQSPALFLAALVLLLCYFSRRRQHKARAVLDLLLALLLTTGGVALYFVGMRMEYFTIRDFYTLRVPGIVGLIIVGVIAVYAALRAFLRYSAVRREEKEAIRAANARRNTEIIAPAQEPPAAAPAAPETPEQP